MIGLIALIIGLTMLNQQYDFLDDKYSAFVNEIMLFLSISLVLIAIASIWKAFIVEGTTFGLVGIFILVNSISINIADTAVIGIIVIALVIAFMAFRVRDYLLLIINALFVVALILSLNSIGITDLTAASIVLLITGIISLYVAVDDWMLVQDIASDYADEMFDDDACCDEACECTCGDDCECKEEEKN